MLKDSKIFVAGHRGLVGSAIYKCLLNAGYKNIIVRTHSELDLENYSAVDNFFSIEQPEYVFLAAAFVGGIMANNIFRADFITKNLQIQNNVIMSSYRYGVKKLLFLGSTCIYPKNAPQPLREEYLLSSQLEYTNEPYAIAKIAGLKMCESYNIQYGTNFICAMPTNLYGPNDNYDLIRGHVLPVILRKIYLANLLKKGDFNKIINDFRKRKQPSYDNKLTELKENNIETYLAQFGVYKDNVTLWGTGEPLREFLWSEDMASACIYLMKKINFSDLVTTTDSGEIRNCHVNIGTGKEISIKELSYIVAKCIGYDGEIRFDEMKPNGTMRKLTDSSKINSLGWHHSVDIEEGVLRLYSDYLK